MQNTRYIFVYQINNMYICINEKRHKFLLTPLWHKKERNERTLY